MASCEQIQMELTEALAHGELRRPRELKAHLRRCETCRTVWNDLRLTWRTLGVLHDEEVPPATLENVRSQALESLAADAVAAESARLGRTMLISVVMGVLFSVTSVWVLGQRADLSSFSPEVLLSMGAAWAAVYAGVMLLVLRDKSFAVTSTIDTRWVALAGLAAMGLSLVLSGSCSVGQALDYCQMSPLVRGLFGKPQNEKLYFVLGGLYSLAPLFLAALLLGAKARGHPFTLGLIAGAVFVALALPGILLQCSAFSVGANLSWVFGAVVGSLAGGSVGSLAGASLSRRLRLRSART